MSNGTRVRRHSLAQTMSLIVLTVLLLVIAMLFINSQVIDTRINDVNSVRESAARQESRLWRLVYLANRLAWLRSAEDRAQASTELSTTIRDFSTGLNLLPSDIQRFDLNLPQTVAQLEEADRQWDQLRESLRAVAETATPEDATTIMGRPEFHREFREILNAVEEASTALTAKTRDQTRLMALIQGAVSVVMVILLGLAFSLARTITNRITSLHVAAQEVTRGNFSARAPVVGNDELTGLSEAFNTMTERVEQQIDSERRARQRIEQVLRALNQTADGLAGAASEILAATSQQAAAAAEEAAAVQETSVTVEELKQVAALATQKAGTVASLAVQSEEVTMSGREAVDRSVDGMARIREQVQSIASSMSRLSEQTQAVGEIIATVQDLAEQSNMLAVNAAIEAARAGEHGFGFSVVANEVRSLAEQSRQATVQVRSILGEIQKAVNTALQSTDAGTRSVENGMELVNRAGEVIRSLTETISHSSNAATQIRASSDQHAAGVDQIAQAIAAIHDASVQALESTRQTERAARVLNEMSMSLKGLLKAGGDSEHEGREPS